MQSSPLVWWEAKQTQRTEAPCLNHPRAVHREATRTHTSRLTASLVPCPRQHGPLDGGPWLLSWEKPRRKPLEASVALDAEETARWPAGATFPASPWPPSLSAWPTAWSWLCCQPGFCGGPVQRWRRPGWAAGPAGPAALSAGRVASGGASPRGAWKRISWEHLPGGPVPGSGLLLAPALWLSLRQAVLFLRPPPTPPCAGRPPDSAQEWI